MVTINCVTHRTNNLVSDAAASASDISLFLSVRPYHLVSYILHSEQCNSMGHVILWESAIERGDTAHVPNVNAHAHTRTHLLHLPDYFNYQKL